MKLRRTHVIILILLAIVIAQPLLAADWNQWRGPQRDGRADGVTLPDEWPETLERAWQIAAGEGHASPVVAGETVFLHSRIDNQETTSAFSLADGSLQWRDAYAAEYDMPGAAAPHGQGPKSTPVIHNGRLYTLGISGILSAYDAASGEVEWRHNFVDEFPIPFALFGTSMSPIVAGDNLIAHVGGKDGGALAAFDLATGNRIWSWSEDGPGYASPILAEIGGASHLITQSEHAFIGVDPESGSLLWQVPYVTPYDQNIVTSIVDGDYVITSGLEQGVAAYHPVKGEAEWSVERVWHNPEAAVYMSSPVLRDGHIFGHSHFKRGQFFRLNGDSGKTVWLSDGSQGENATLVSIDDWMLWLTTEGKLLVTRVDADTFDPVAGYTLSETPIWAHLVVTPQGFLVKDASTLSLWNLPE